MTQLEIKREAVRKPFNRRRKACPFSGPNAPKIDYKDTKLLARYTSERGKIVPSRISAVSAKKQRELATACLLYTSPSPRDGLLSRMPSSA